MPRVGAKLDGVDLKEPGIQEVTPTSADRVPIYDASANVMGWMDPTDLYLGGTQLTATAAEINRIADKSASVVDVTAATVSLTVADHGDRIITLNRAAGVTVTLPAATGSGVSFTIVIGTAATSNANIIETSATTEHMTGSLRGVDDDAEGATGYQWNAETNDDTITMDGTATGGKAGDTIILLDYEATNWTVRGHLTQSGGSEATPFSAAVS